MFEGVPDNVNKSFKHFDILKYTVTLSFFWLIHLLFTECVNLNALKMLQVKCGFNGGFKYIIFEISFGTNEFCEATVNRMTLNPLAAVGLSPSLSLLDHRVGPQGTISGSMTNSFISSLVCHISWRWEFNSLFLFATLQTGVMYCREHVDIGIPVERWKSERKAASSFSFTGVRFIASFKAFL